MASVSVVSVCFYGIGIGIGSFQAYTSDTLRILIFPKSLEVHTFHEDINMKQVLGTKNTILF